MRKQPCTADIKQYTPSINDQEKNFWKCSTTTFTYVKLRVMSSTEVEVGCSGRPWWLPSPPWNDCEERFLQNMSGNHNLTAQRMWHHTCLHRNTYCLVLKAHLCTCIDFFKHTVTKICQPHRWHRTHNHLHHVSHKMFFFPFTPHLLPFPITVYNPAWQVTLLRVPLSSGPLVPPLSCERDSIIHKQEAHNTASWYSSTSDKELVWVGWERDRTFCN